MRRWPLERLQAVAGTRDVEYVEETPVVVLIGYSTREVLQPRTIIRIGEQYLVEAGDDPDHWYMGQLVGGEVVCHGMYGQLGDAIRAL
jgi:hypothetical protein